MSCFHGVTTNRKRAGGDGANGVAYFRSTSEECVHPLGSSPKYRCPASSSEFQRVCATRSPVHFLFFPQRPRLTERITTTTDTHHTHTPCRDATFMMDPGQVATIEAHPLGIHLDAVRASFNEIATGPDDLDTLSHEGKCGSQLVPACSNTNLDLQNSGLALFSAFLNHPASRRLPSQTGHGNLLPDISKLIPALASNTVQPNRIKPLLRAVLAHQPDTEIWEQVYHAVTESTPPRKAISSILQTPWRLTTSSVVNSSEKRDQMDKLLSDELGVMYVDVPNFYEAFWGGIPQLETASEDIFQKCTRGPQPLFQQGWTGWSRDAKQESVLVWLADIVERFLQWAQEYRPTTTRRPLAQPDTPFEGSVAKRKLDVGLVDDPKADKAGKYYWSHILVLGELKSNPNDDTASKAHLDIARYIKEVFIAQPTRRFVLAFTLCRSWMRL
ncbi:hypothetical protein CIB48_g9274 [Xylaria polymorpha]|nr:hypothetical protein CIB48_g9274 [Xylaria polymorpha]